ncbi:MAG: HAMP domain-containing sensor histidine kinase [Hydrogenophaga sp.]|nr:HAMP domain-containing sensor histidine kinase [Hydrogenophaga sp.]
MTVGPARRSLSRLLVKSVLIVAWTVGLLISLLQVAYDLHQVRQLPAANLATVRGMTQEPLDASVYGLDQARVADLLAGLMTLPYIREAKVVLDDGTVLAETTRPERASSMPWLNNLLFGPPRQFVWSIQSPSGRKFQWLGEIQITYDTHAEANAFLSRAGTILFGTMFYALVLAALLLLTYDRVLRRPLANIIQSIQAADVDRPESARLAVPPGHANTEIGQLAAITNLHLSSIDRLLTQLRQAEQQLNDYSDQLEVTVSERTRELSRSLDQLQNARDQLINNERLASLGTLVAGVAHEVNTPLGIAVTAASVVSEALDAIRAQFQADSLTREEFASLMRQANEGQLIVVGNLSRAAKLVRDFKQAAANQADETLCEYDIAQTTRALIASLHPETKKIPVQPRFDGPVLLKGVGYPGVLMQVLTNLIMNSVRHAFDGIAQPQIHIELCESGGQVELIYRDNGVGVPAALHNRIFEPLFTTRRGRGGTGLGLNIVYNLVTQKMAGQLDFWSAPQRGVTFRVRFALKQPWESQEAQATREAASEAVSLP